MISALVGIVLGTAGLPTVETKSLHLFLEQAQETGSLLTGQSTFGHVLYLTFRHYGRKYGDADECDPMLAIRSPGVVHALGGQTDPEIHSGFDHDTGNTDPSGTWTHVHLASMGVPGESGQTLQVYIGVDQGESLDPESLGIAYIERARYGSSWSRYYYLADYRIYKQEADGDGPIDSRFMYGAYNDTWDTIDPNGELRNPIFNPWSFRGGLFVGSMAHETGDRSRTARTQLWFPALSGQYAEHDLENVACAHVSLFHLGFWPIPPTENIPNDTDLRPWLGLDDGISLYAGPSSTSVTESTANWGNKWSPGTTGYDNDTFGAWDPTSSGSSKRDYMNWQFTTAAKNTEGTDVSVTYPGDALRRVILMLKGESSVESAGVSRWRYFVSKEGSAGPFPGGDNSYICYDDADPRLWVYCLANGTTHEDTP